MRISILGEGAVGGVLGGLLSLSGHSVYFLPKAAAAAGTSRAAGPKTVHKRGGAFRAESRPLRLILPDGWRLASRVSRKPDGADLLLITLGRHHMKLLRKDALKGFDECPVVFANADPAEPIRLGFKAHQASHLLTLMDAVSLQEGEAEIASTRTVLLMEKGSPFTPLAAEMTALGVEHRTVDDIAACMGSFFISQLLYLPTALCNTTLSHFLSFPEGRDLARRLLSEGLRMQEKTGGKTAKLPVMDPRELLEKLERTRSGWEEGRRQPGRAYSPILQDMLRGKPTEAREITKRAIEAAASVGLEMPWNWKLYQKAGRVAGLGWFESPRELAASLA